MSARYLTVIEGDGATNYSAYSPDLPGCVATGDTREECERQMQEAIAFHLEGLAEQGLPVPDPSTIEVDAIAVEDVAQA